ncbi:MAG TPA: VWA domain-containing protein [Pyrinomonadaceae bacterium]|nr:VWA domain-containing protein [Pyrinomonadaceae bacterium]
MRALLLVTLALGSALACARAARAQEACLSDADVRAMLAHVNSAQASPPAPPNEKLRETLLKLKEESLKSFRDSYPGAAKEEELLKRLRASREKNSARLCPLLKEFGWPAAEAVGRDGVAAAFYLLKNGASFEMQRDLLPVVVAATKKGEIERADFAAYFDRLRLSAGLKQLFATQATIEDGLIVLYPVEGQEFVDERRRQYGLPPLDAYIRSLERIYRLPLVRAPGALSKKFAEGPNAALARAGQTLFTDEAVGEDEVVRVETNLVSLNVSVYSNKLKAHVGTLSQKDFAVFEDGRPEEVSFFAATDVPFDLVLLLDLSGSTVGKRDLIRKTTRRFIEAVRPSDRVAVVVFSDGVSVVSPLTGDRQTLLQSVQKIDGNGGSNVWDALKFTLDKVVGPNTLERRRAVVMLTDGVDGALMSWARRGSRTLFSELLETVRQTDALVVPIYLDTEGDDALSRRLYASARRTLSMLADESGGLYYKAKNLGDLDGVYAQVIEDLGKVYSLGYKPTNDRRDGLWREVKVTIRDRPDLSARARPGYYAK